MCVANGDWSSSICSRFTVSSKPSNRRFPPPRMTGAIEIESSSTCPARSAWRITSAPPGGMLIRTTWQCSPVDNPSEGRVPHRSSIRCPPVGRPSSPGAPSVPFGRRCRSFPATARTQRCTPRSGVANSVMRSPDPLSIGMVWEPLTHHGRTGSQRGQRSEGPMHSIATVIRRLAAGATVALTACTSGGVAPSESQATASAPSTRPSLELPANGTPAAAASGAIDLSTLTGRIAFSGGSPGAEDVYVVNADGTGLRRVTTDPEAQFDPTWSPDGRRIAYRYQKGTDFMTTDIYLANADGSGATILTRSAGSVDWGPAWSPDDWRHRSVPHAVHDERGRLGGAAGDGHVRAIRRLVAGWRVSGLLPGTEHRSPGRIRTHLSRCSSW